MRIDHLNDREKECLRLVLHPMRAKQIARETGLSVHTVNDHLRSARRKLGTNDSVTAAQILRDHEGHPPKDLGPIQSGWREPAVMLQAGGTEVARAWSAILPAPWKDRPWNDLSLRWRIIWPILLLGLLALGTGILVGGIAALSQLALLLAR
jgi:DNA-binding CsgD family transcriptional regulator